MSDTTDTTTPPLPPTRILSPYGYNEACDVEDETYLCEIEDAICNGRILSSLTGGERNRGGGRQQEVSVTRFRDPRTSEVRCAVEVWNDGRNGRYDYADRTVASEQAGEWSRLINLRPTGR
ncbi:hypothetical protein [Streptomyces cucumeris]|uniref:hypothetical protein n=1 Tax=Streptomyces cucumeris TaxID=2962890 RepID=UPI0020C845FF|nr:hypothetical protein [Streptomyces sp. NEAU-Y11]MCP9209624.1 hypothetical protein [Streptomyces sp. NEAU-Y11]